MPKAHKRKSPVTSTPHCPQASPSSKSTRTVIRQFHVLLKQQARLLNKPPDKLTDQELARINEDLSRLGGLEVYQRMSAAAQDNERGGGSEKILIDWLRDIWQRSSTSGRKLRYDTDRWPLHPPPFCQRSHSRFASCIEYRLLEVGALTPNNYRSCSSWLECTSIDLHSRHPSIQEQDFLLLDEDENHEQWDVISLSLVLNFVPRPKERGELMLSGCNMETSNHLDRTNAQVRLYITEAWRVFVRRCK